MQRELNFPVPGFVSSSAWTNQWYVGNSEGTVARFNDMGQLNVEKAHGHTAHVMLNALPADLKRLREGRGVVLDHFRAYSVHLNASKSRELKVQLAIHEYDSEGTQISRKLVENGHRVLYVAVDTASHLVLSIRTTGPGSMTVKNLEFNPTQNNQSKGPGLHPLEQVETLVVPTKLEALSEIYALMPVRQALYAGTPLTALLTRLQARQILGTLINNRHMLDAKVVVEQFNLYSDLTTRQLRVLFWHGRKAGYVAHALECIDEIFERSENAKDELVARKLRSEYEFHRDPWSLLRPSKQSSHYDPAGPVLHMVGKAMPEKQTGYTVRTKYTVEALLRAGIDSVIAVQVAGNHEDGLDATQEMDVNGIHTVLFGGAPARDDLKESWLQRNADELEALVSRVKPSAIHAHSDFTNGVLATHVGEASNVPVVYESRGFWEETWISRVSKSQGWDDLEQVVRMYGVPDLYTLRRLSERRVRERADRIVTLAQTMKDFILEESPDGLVPAEHVYLARNAVDGKDFPVEERNSDVRSRLGISEDGVVIGYISSMVEYEGVETLIDGFRKLSRVRDNVRLLLVGDGMHLNSLKRHAEKVGSEGIIFTGRVPHEDVIDYYHAIDVFVIPRRKTRVTDLVTPLKPFEAFSTGKPVVMSDVSALAEIAADSGGAARVFSADDSDALAEILIELAGDPEARADMGSKGARWVRAERSWDSNVAVYSEVYSDLRKSKA